MELKVVKNQEELGNYVADIIQETINKKNKEKGKTVIGLATGSTPIPVYQELIRRYDEGKLDFTNVTSFNLDEYVGIDYSNENSYHKFMDDNLFDHININKNNVFVPDGNAKDLNEEVKEYENKIVEAGGVDIQLLGIGANGHVAFNEPAENLSLKTHVVDLTESTIEANSRFFETRDEVPKQAMTMGIGTVFSAEKIVLMATGKNKKEAIKSLIADNNITTQSPATLLKPHKNITVVIEQELYDEIYN